MSAGLEERVEVIEKQLAELLSGHSTNGRQSWRNTVGDFAEDPGFEEMMRLGKEYRQQQKLDVDADS